MKRKNITRTGKTIRSAVGLFLAVLLLFVTAVPSAALQTPPFAGSEMNVVTGDWMTEFTDYDITILGTHKWGQFRMLKTENGDPVYCIDWTTPSGKVNKVKDLRNTEEWKRMDIYQQDIIRYAVVCGYPVSQLGQSANAAYMATQIVIWEAEACRRVSTDSSFNSPFGGWLAENPEVKAAYDSLLAAMENFNKVPDFSAWDVCLEGIGTDYSRHIEDRNGVASSYVWTASDPNIKVSVAENGLDIYTSGEFSGFAEITGVKKLPETGVNGRPLTAAVCLQGDGTQAILYGIPDPNVSSRLGVTLAPRGGAGINKTDENGNPLSGVVFGVYSDSLCENLLGEIVTGNDGNAFYGISDGNYTVSAGTLLYFKELRPKDDTFVPDTGLYFVRVEANRINYANNGGSVINRPKTGTVIIRKEAEDGRTAGTKFRITGTADNETNIDRIVTIEGSDEVLVSLPIGNYTVSEIEVLSKYIPPEAQNAVVAWDQYTELTFVNNLKRGSLTVTKTAEDGLCEDARFHLYGTSFSGLPVDEYAVV